MRRCCDVRSGGTVRNLASKVTSIPHRVGTPSIDASFETHRWQSLELTNQLSSHPLLIMDTRAYLGKGLSLPQLVSALNAEFTSMSYSQS